MTWKSEESRESPEVLKSIPFYSRSLEEHQESGCLWGGKLGHLEQGGRRKNNMTLLLQPGYTVVTALKRMMTFCKQPFVDISDCTFYLGIRQKTDVCLFMASLARSAAGSTCCLHIFLIFPPLPTLLTPVSQNLIRSSRWPLEPQEQDSNSSGATSVGVTWNCTRFKRSH